MKTYHVQIPITGYCLATVVLPDTATAEEIYLAAIETADPPEEYEFCQEIVRGNTFCGMLNECVIECEPDTVEDE